jgi:ankyrin repeat protein
VHDRCVAEYRRALRVRRPPTHLRGVPALVYLAREGFEDLALIASQARKAVDSADVNGMTALHHAAHGGLDRLVAQLLRQGSDPHARSRDVAISEKLEEDRAAEESAADGGAPRLWPARLWSARQPRRRPRRPLRFTVGGRTPLHFAAAEGHTSCVALLLRASAECAVLTDWHGVSPLQLACRHGHDEASRLLHVATASTLGAGANELVAWDRRLQAGAAAAEECGLRERQRARLRIEERPLLHTPYVLPALWPPKLCGELVAAAEDHGQTHGWSTGRHPWHSTVDLPLAALCDRLYAAVRASLEGVVLPSLRERYQTRPLHVSELFLARYCAPAVTAAASSTQAAVKGPRQAGLGMHRDGTLLNCVVLLNEPTEFEGGGTRFGPPLDAVYQVRHTCHLPPISLHLLEISC